MQRPRAFAALFAIAAIASAGCADGQHPSAADGTVEISMTEMAFTPEHLTARQGDEMTLRFINDGTVRHEAVIGDAAIQAAHAEAMGAGGHDAPHHDRAAMPGPENHHGSPPTHHEQAPHHGGDHNDHAGLLGAVVLEPGEMEVVRFSVPDDANELVIGCHEPGHWEAGMQATIAIER